MAGSTWVLGLAVLGATACASASESGPLPAVDRDAILASAAWIADAAMARAAEGAQWTPEGGLDERATPMRGPFPLFRKAFTLRPDSRVQRAELVVTALGSYQVRLNGQRTSDAILAPGWTDYRRRLLYQTHDVTPLLQRGENVLGVLLGEGWYGSAVRITPYLYGPPPIRFKGALIVSYADGRVETIVSDESWRSTGGPIQWARIFDGETFDARRRPAGWDRAGFDDAAWAPVRVLGPLPALTPAGPPILEAQAAEEIRPTQTLTPVRRVRLSIDTIGPDTVMYDFGQNMVGWTRIEARGPAGGTVTIRHAELLMPDRRHIDQGNLRNAAATDSYTLAGTGTGAERLEPHFTYHGFRYVEVVTSPGVEAEAPVGIVFHSDAPRTLTFESSDPRVERLWQNIAWSLRGNLMSVPTDCPQRAERLAWLGDAAAFWPTAVYLMDLDRFTGKWLADLRDGQQTIIDWTAGDRVIPHDLARAVYSEVHPAMAGCYPAHMPPPSGCGGPGWSDAGVLVPYAAYRHYGDTAQVRTHWASMERYMRFIEANNPDYRWEKFNGGFGDWGAPTRTGSGIIATAMWAADALAMRAMARGLGDREAEARYAALYEKIQAAFAAGYISAKGEVGEVFLVRSTPADTMPRWHMSQTGDVLALRYGLVPDSLRATVTDHLVGNIAWHRGRIASGFLGSTRMLPALSENGRDDIAYQLLLNDGPPSWLFMISQSATTMWEYWDGGVDGSWNHYALGAVGEWMIRYAVGIGQDTGSVAFERIVIRPHVDPYARLTRMGATYRSRRGDIRSVWTIDTTTMAVTLEVTIPPGPHARVDVPVWRGDRYVYRSRTVAPGAHRFVGTDH